MEAISLNHLIRLADNDATLSLNQNNHEIHLNVCVNQNNEPWNLDDLDGSDNSRFTYDESDGLGKTKNKNM